MLCKLDLNLIFKYAFLAALFLLSFSELAATALFVTAFLLALVICVREKFFPLKTAGAVLIGLFCLQAALSLHNAPDIMYAVTLCVFTLLRYIIVAVAAAVYVRKTGWKYLLAVTAAAAVISAIYGYYQVLFVPDIENKEWIDAEKFGAITWRIFGTWSNPNIFGGYMLYALSSAFCIARFYTLNLKLRITAYSLAALFVATIILTFSRGVWIALIVMLVLDSVIFLGKRFWMIFSPVIAVFFATGVLWHRLQSVVTASDSSSIMRLALWASTEKMIAAHPLFGWGWGLYWFYYPQFDYLLQTAGLKVYHAHNTYLHYAAEAGIPATVIFLAILFIAIYYSLARTDGPDAKTDKANAVLLVAFAVLLFTDHILFNTRISMLFWSFIGGAMCRRLNINEID